MNNRPGMDFVAFYAARQPPRLAAMDMRPSRAWNYAELDQAISRCVAVLAERGIGREDRVAILARNCVHLIIMHLACSRHGAIFVALNWRLAAVELTEILLDAAEDYAARGYEQVFSDVTPAGTRVAYFDTTRDLRGMVELIEMNATPVRRYARMYAAAVAWDGQDPIRRS